MSKPRSQCVVCLDGLTYDDGEWLSNETGSSICGDRGREHRPFEMDAGPGVPPVGVRGPVRLCWAEVSWAQDSATVNAVTITVDPDGVTYVDVVADAVARVFVNGVERHAPPF